MKSSIRSVSRRAQAGFTMIELIVVIVILGVLAATALPKFFDLGVDARAAALQGVVGASLQAEVSLGVTPEDLALLQTLGDDLKFVLIVSAVELAEGHSTQIEVNPAKAAKCERCWHYRDDVGANPEHPTICGRCDSNLHGDGESRVHA